MKKENHRILVNLVPTMTYQIEKIPLNRILCFFRMIDIYQKLLLQAEDTLLPLTKLIKHNPLAKIL